MDRTSVLASLQSVAPALATKDTIPALACLCFAEGRVTAYDGKIALVAPTELGIEGGLRGSLVLDFLSGSPARDVDFDDSKPGTVVVKAGRARCAIALLKPDEFAFVEPPIGGSLLPRSSGFLLALEKCAIAMGTDEAALWRMGVTVVLRNGDLTLYSTDNVTFTAARVTGTGFDEELTCVLNPAFVTNLLRIAKKDKVESITLNQSLVLASFESGLLLYGLTINDARPERYEKTIATVKDADGQFTVTIPEGLESALKRATLALRGGDMRLSVNMDGTSLRIRASGPYAIVTDRMDVEEQNAGRADFVVSPALLQRALAIGTRITVGGESAIAVQGTYPDAAVEVSHYIALHQKKEETTLDDAVDSVDDSDLDTEAESA